MKMELITFIQLQFISTLTYIPYFVFNNLTSGSRNSKEVKDPWSLEKELGALDRTAALF
jgi:hypothetical protein